MYIIHLACVCFFVLMMTKVMNTIFPTTEPVSNTPSATVGPSMYVLAGSVVAETESNIKHYIMLIYNTQQPNYQLTLQVQTERLDNATSSGNSAAVDASYQRFIATSIQANSTNASDYVESL